MSEKDEDDGNRISGASNNQCGGHRQNEKNNMNPGSTHQGALFLFLMTIPVQLFFVFVFSHLLPSLLHDASHIITPFH
jgi:hypothetical protein